MKTERQFWKRGRHWLLAAGVLLSSGNVLTSCTEYDLDERTPDGWGSSISSWLQEQGNFTNTVNLINDLRYNEVLGKTGSKTLFVANDAAYRRFFQNNSWGVRSYGQLSTSQKKLLLNGAMLNNSMQLNSLASVEGNPPTEGECLRRLAASDTYDSVAVITPDKMPNNKYWRYYAQNGKSIVCMLDNSVVPVVLFVEKLLQNKRITNDDYNFLFNHTTNRQAGDASVNGVQVINANIKCSNGFIHQMADVVTPLPNMAELIAQKSNVSLYNSLLERYCAPYPLSNSVAENYNYLYNANVDTVFQKRFFSKKSQNGIAVNLSPTRGPVGGLLKYDPEWNSYYSSDDVQDANVMMQKDMGVMMVPSNEALTEYWENGAGRVLKEYYGTWENVPDEVIQELINNNMLSSFVQSVPSKFKGILNDANDPMGVFSRCFHRMYGTSPTAYVSVSFPALINETMKIMYWGIKQLQYNVYLNSLNSYYSFFIPTNNALLEYIDPCSFGKSKTQLFRFHYDSTKPNEDDRVWASIWNYDLETREVGDSIGLASYYQIKDRLQDILDTHIVIGNVEDGKQYYRTKGGTEIRVNNVAAGANGMTVEGSYQINESHQPVPVSVIYDQTGGASEGDAKGKGNGKSYILESEPIMGTRKTVHSILSEHEDDFKLFLELMEGSGLFEDVHVVGSQKNALGGSNVSVFNTYHYTIYVPANEGVQELIDKGKLPTWETVAAHEAAGNLTAKTQDSLKIMNFLKYHIQDNALFIGAKEESGDYETSVIDPTTERFYRVHAVLSGSNIEITDHAGNTRHVVTSNPELYNLMARELMYNSSDAASAGEIETSSSAVIHLIDKPLLLEK